MTLTYTAKKWVKRIAILLAILAFIYWGEPNIKIEFKR